jgi:hypothetical protein
MSTNFAKSIFHPKNIEKYKGKLPIIARSSWETHMMHFLDTNSSVVSWSSESLSIPYLNPFTNRWTRYFPDFVITLKDKATGKESLEVIEVKPFKQTRAPVKSAKKSKKTVYIESKAWVINNAKWAATQAYCQKNGITFRIITEKELFLPK